MPTYLVHARSGQLSKEQKAAIAKGITTAHSQSTGAQAFFAQVLFKNVHRDDWFLAGDALREDLIFVLGYIRAGRDADVKRNLLLSIRDVLIEHGDVATDNAWVYLNDIPAAHIVEYGDVLPDPGNEQAWMDNLPKKTLERLLAPAG